MKIKVLKYAMIWTGLACGAVALASENWLAFAMPIYAFALVPFLELFTKPDAVNMSKTEMEIARNDRAYDYMLYILVLAQYALLVWFCISVSSNLMRAISSSR